MLSSRMLLSDLLLQSREVKRVAPVEIQELEEVVIGVTRDIGADGVRRESHVVPVPRIAQDAQDLLGYASPVVGGKNKRVADVAHDEESPAHAVADAANGHPRARLHVRQAVNA